MSLLYYWEIDIWPIFKNVIIDSLNYTFISFYKKFGDFLFFFCKEKMTQDDRASRKTFLF